MDAKLIEKLDRQRYWALIWATIGFGIVGGSMISEEITEIFGIELSSGLTQISGGLYLVGFIILVAMFIRWLSSVRQLERNPAIKKAIDNELVKLYRYKSLKLGLIVAVSLAYILSFLEAWLPMLTVKLVCLSIWFLSGLSIAISLLIYLRR
jgi:MFS family permease